MKVLYVGHLNEQSGWGISGRNILRALSTQDIDLCARSIKVNHSYEDEITKEYTSKKLFKPDVVLQYVLPNHYEYNGNWKNVAYWMTECVSLPLSKWEQKLSLMDAAIFPHSGYTFFNNYEGKSCSIPLPCDTARFQPKQKKQDGIYRFYTICDNNPRKNLFDLVRAYFCTFEFYEPVELLIKLSGNEEQNQKYLEELIKDVAETLRMNKDGSLPRIQAVTKHISEQVIDKIHQDCNCFVTTSYGEGWNKPCFDAYAFGNEIISPNEYPYMDYVNNRLSYEVVSDGCFAYKSFMDTAYTGRDSWYSPDFSSLCEVMRIAYNKKAQYQLPNVSDYSFDSIGKEMVDFFEELLC